MEVVNKLLLKYATCRTPVITLIRNQSKTAAAIYTKNGDGGLTYAGSGELKPKDDSIFDAIGATDELSSYIGLAREFAIDGQHSYVDKLNRIQCILVDISTAISKCSSSELVRLSSRHTKDLEEWIDEYSKQLPPLENYVIPGGGKACASLHVARTICRRAERCVVPLVRKGELHNEAQVYLNRLSDFLFTISRLAAKCDKKGENIYIPRPEPIAKEKAAQQK
ncbi:corrinoid adenosyltransferase MMAB-like [Schistocerca nitens]|uniref:corrinoid adenosyltransferase MMAB-like n=1 Tax=Schistocerca cancellata TaxID=274614 RepID=UPI002119429F|nr:corrinoid adenosyltransferase MMAB-like [Schistocerca cancellata]XP_049788539.1 corrinoid adenosyltransferase MMAB-like [Schistocerca nitens]